MSPYAPTLDDMPALLPVFPLPEVVLLPGGRLPLNIFEPRYLAMVEDAIGHDRTIGMIQPVDAARNCAKPKLYGTGCAGRICQFEETGDGRYLIALRGICRFSVVDELDEKSGYRRVRADWSTFAGDLSPGRESCRLDRSRLLSALCGYFDCQGIAADWEAINQAPDERLVNCLAMICPFGTPEKQALLEAPDLEARAKVLMALVEMGSLAKGCPGGSKTCQ